MNKTLINLAYELSVDNFKEKQFSFNDIWSKVTKQVRLGEDAKKEVGEFYADLIQDARFVYCGANSWKLKKYIKINDLTNMQSLLYDFSTETVYEDGFEVKQDVLNEDTVLIDASFADDYIEDVWFDEDVEEIYEDISKKMASNKSEEE